MLTKDWNLAWIWVAAAVLCTNGTGCTDSSEDDEALETQEWQEGDSGEGIQLAPIPLPSAGEGAIAIASIRSPTGSTVSFYEVGDGAERSVFVLEHGAPHQLVLDAIVDSTEHAIEAHEIYVGLMAEHPTALASVPRRLIELSQGATLHASKPGWANVVLEEAGLASATDPTAAATIACVDSSFTASTAGGFLAVMWIWLNLTKDNNPAAWVEYDLCEYCGECKTYGQHVAGWNGITKWRGKACGRWVSDSGLCEFPNPNPGATFRWWSNSQGAWQTVLETFFFSSAQAYAWYWNGTGGTTLNWRLQLFGAYEDHEFDYLMSKP